MGLQSSKSLTTNNQLTRTLSRSNFNAPEYPVDHENVLKLRTVPFRNCMRVSQSPALFLESADYTLLEILQQRHNTTKLLTEEDILKLLEAILYALAYLQSKGVVYKDLVPENIYYQAEERVFKLLPPELIDKSAFRMIRQGSRFSMASPQMIVALRSQSLWITNEMYHRSNVFTLGMIMLEVATLRTSSDCYEPGSMDILDRVVRERLAMVDRFYPAMFRQLLEAMLCYDYEQRRNPQQMSVYLFDMMKAGNTAISKVLHQVKEIPNQVLQRSSAATSRTHEPNTAQTKTSHQKPRLNMSLVRDTSPRQQVAPQTAKARYSEMPFASPRGIAITQVNFSPERQDQHYQPPSNNSRVSKSIVVRTSYPKENPQTQYVNHDSTPIKQIIVSRTPPKRQSVVSQNPLDIIEEKAELPEGICAQRQDTFEASEIPTARSNEAESSFNVTFDQQARDPIQKKTMRLVKQMVEPNSFRQTLPVRFHSRSPETQRNGHQKLNDHYQTFGRQQSRVRQESSGHRSIQSGGMEIDDIDDEIARVKEQLKESKRLLESYQARGSATRRTAV